MAVADAKYKSLAPASMPNADAYQMLAYCAAIGLPRGFLIYAKDNGAEARTHSVINASCSIEVRTLDVEAHPEVLLAQVEVLAAEIARNRTETGWASRMQPVAYRCSQRGDLGAGDKPSDNTSRQRQMQRDAARHRNPSDLQ